MIKQRETNSWKSVSYAKSITGTQTYTKIPIVLRTTEQSIPTWSVKGNMVQSGTPTPTSPIYPSECGDRTENLFDVQNYVTNISTHNCTVSVAANGVKITATGSDAYAGEAYKTPDRANANDRAAAIPVTENTTYVLSADVNTFSGCYIAYLDSSYYAINSDYIGIGANVPYKFTTPAGTAYVALRFGDWNLQSGQSKTFANLTLAKDGLYKLPIVSGGVTTNVYLSEPLRKRDSEYANVVDSLVSSGITRYVKKAILTGQETSAELAMSSADNHFFVYKVEPAIPNNQGYALCSHYQTEQVSDSLMSDVRVKQTRSGYWGGTSGAVLFKDSSYSTLEDFKAFLAQEYANGTPVTIWYILTTAETETITMPTIPTTSGLNTIDVNTTLKPSEMSLTYDGYKLCKGQRYSRTENLFDGTIEQGSFNADGSETTWSDITYRVRSTFLGELSSGTYTINCSGADDVVVNVYETSDTSTFKSDESLTSWQSLPRTFTLTANRFVRFAFRKSDNSDIAPSEISNLMLNTGSTAKPYQPYLDWE